MDTTYSKEAALSIAVVTLAFIAYHFITSASYSKFFKGERNDNESIKEQEIIFQRLTGVLFFGIIPAFIILFMGGSFSRYGLTVLNGNMAIRWGLALAVPLFVMNLFFAKSKQNLAMYPQIRKSVWTYSTLLLSALSWIAYLFAYEFLFRGFLLFSCYYAFGLYPAIVINISLYALVHIPKGLNETLGAIPLGLVVCILGIQTGNIWVALIAHVVLALSNEWLSLAAHPGIKLVRKFRPK